MNTALKYALAIIAFALSFGTGHIYAQISAEQTLSIARQLIDNEDYALAVQYLNKAIQAKPYMSEPVYLRGLSKMMLGDYTGAQEDCSKAISLNTYKRDPYRVRGICLLHKGDYTHALADFRQGLSLHPDDRTFLYYTAVAQSLNGEYTQSINSFSRLERLYPSFTSAYYAHARSMLAANDTANALNLLHSIPPENADAADLTLLRAHLAMEQHRWADANKELTAAIRIMPHSDILYLNRGVVRHILSDNNGAISDFRSALELNPDNRQAVANLRHPDTAFVPLPLSDIWLLPAKHDATAKADIHPCPLFALTFTHPYDNLHPVTYHCDELALLNAKGRFPSPLYLSTTAADTPDPDQAVALFAFAEEPVRDVDINKLTARAVAYAMLKNYDSALADLNTVINNAPDRVLPYLERAFIHTAIADNALTSGRHSRTQDRITLEAQRNDALRQAISDLDTALSLDPTLTYVNYNRAALSYLTGQYTDAIKYYTKAIHQNPRLPQAYFNRALSHRQNGDIKAATADWSRAGELGLPAAYVLIRQAEKETH